MRERKLAAILAADVAGYSSFMEQDEAGALARVDAAFHGVLEPRVATHGGRIVKFMGDGALAEFASVVEAVRCALDVQATLAADGGAQLRIGVNVGDVITAAGDIFGDGVNVAARLQALAAPGGIAVSRSVREQIAGKIDAAFEDMGEHQVKNLARPVHMFAWGGVNVGEARGADDGRISVCVLPFDNMSGDPEQDYFSDGVTEDIITDLSKVSALAVASRNTSFALRGKGLTVAEVSRRMRAAYVLEGSVRKAGNRVRITAQLIEGRSDSHVWAERYDRDLNDIFALQDEIAQAIVAALKLKLAPGEKEAIKLRSTSNPEAYKIFLMARQFSMLGHARHRDLVVNLCKHAVEIDPGYARAWALMAIAQSNIALFVDVPENGWAAAERALALDPDLAEAHSAKGRILGDLGRYDEAKLEHDIALRIDSESYHVMCAAARCAVAARRFEDAVTYLEKATRLFDGDVWAAGMVIQCYEATNPAQVKPAARRALDRIEKVITMEPDHALALGFGVTALVALREIDRAKEWAKRALLVDPSNRNLTYNIGCSMIKAGEIEMGIDLVEITIKSSKTANLIWVETDSDLDSVRNHPRFVALVEDARERYKAGATT